MEDGQIIKWTDFHKYIRTGKKQIAVPLKNDENKAFHAVIPFLNYVYFNKYDINRLTEVNVDMVRHYMNDYGLCKLPDDDEFTARSENTVKTNIYYILSFLEEFIDANPSSLLKRSDLIKDVEVYSKSARRYVTKKVPAFKVVYNSEPNPIFRDIPEKAFEIIMNEIITNYRDILMLAALQAFAGMRPSEACNVRRPDSLLGPGIVFSYIDGKVHDVSIDLKRKYVLRSDLVDVGGIKKFRTQRVYPQFLKVFIDCYNLYMQFIDDRKYESEYGPLSINRQGKAYTYHSYLYRFRKAVKSAQIKMRDSDDPETVYYSFLLDEQNISPHILRHWFSVKLTLYGEDASGLQYWRGDSSIESSLTYISNKSDLEKQYRYVVDKLFDYELWRSEKENAEP